MPGETVACQRFWLRDLFAFYDTPGFQNAIEALGELEAAARASEPVAVFRAFLSRNAGKQDFEAECRLLEPIVKEDAGIVYVVDGSEPLLDIHVAEMEILRLTGQPRLPSSIEPSPKTIWRNGAGAWRYTSMRCANSTLITQLSQIALNCLRRSRESNSAGNPA